MESKHMNEIEYKVSKVKEILDIMAKHEQIIFRGGTALSLAYGEIERSSEDIDFSILKGKDSILAVVFFWLMKLKNLIE